MVLDNKIKAIRDAFNINTLEGWALIKPSWITELHGVGPETLNHVRLYLAARGLTLRDDFSPDHWQEKLGKAKLGGSLTDQDKALLSTFVVLIDSKEQQPFTFEGTRTDSDQGCKPLIVQKLIKDLGANHGDYSLDGYERAVHIERKGPGDAVSTFLAAPDTERGINWRKTLNFLAEIPTAAVVIECTRGQMLSLVESRGKRSKAALVKTLFRQVLAWEDDYRIPFIFCDDRRMAEMATLALLRRFYKHETHKKNVSLETDAVHDYL